MKLNRLALITILFCAAAGAAHGQVPDAPQTPPTTPTPAPKPREAQIRNFRLHNLIARIEGGGSKPVSEYVSVSLGPVGEVYLVSGLNDYIKVDSNRVVSNVYPSLIFDMSASPNISDKKTDGGGHKVGNTGYDLEWRDVTVTLTPLCKGGALCEDPSAALGILEVLPNKTSSGHRDSVPAQVAGVLTDLANASAPFFPASTFNEKVAAAGSGLSVLFRNLFPPVTETYYHAFVGDDRTFGWNFKQDKQTAADTSLLGLHRGIVLLRASKEVVSIKIECKVLSKWNKKVVKDSFNDFSQSFTFDLPEVKDNATDYEALGNLDTFPALIHVGDLLNILHLVKDEDYNKLKGEWKLEDGKELYSVTKESVRGYLKLHGYNDDQSNDIISGYPDSISKADVIKLVCQYNYPDCPADPRGATASGQDAQTNGNTQPQKKIQLPPNIEFVDIYAKRSTVEEYLGIKKHPKKRDDYEAGSR